MNNAFVVRRVLSAENSVIACGAIGHRDKSAKEHYLPAVQTVRMLQGYMSRDELNESAVGQCSGASTDRQLYLARVK